MKKEIYILIGLVAIFSLVPVLSAKAVTITTLTVTPSNVYGGYISDYNISFVVASSTEIESKIVLTFPDGFNVANAATSTASTTGASVLASSTIAGQVITLQLNGGAVDPTGETAEVNLTGIVNPYTGGSLTITLATLTEAGGAIDSGTSAAFSITPGQTSSSSGDRTAPNSYITSPTAGLTITTGEKYAVKGTAQDAGGSSVQKVEISLDGGNSWSIAEIKSALNNVFSWEYVWQNPAKGEYVIKARATDTVGNLASPSAGVKVTVSAAESAVVPPAVSPEKPITEMTVPELEAKIIEVQQKIVDVLGQLIQLFQQQIQALLPK